MKKIITIALLCTLTACGKSDRVEVDRFAVKDEPVTVWVETGAHIYKDRKLIINATQDAEIKLSLPGNYKIFDKK